MDPKVNQRIKRQMREKKAEKPVDKIRVENQIEILNYTIFKEALSRQVDGVRKQFTKSLHTYKNTPTKDLLQNGYLDNYVWMVDEFVKISNKESKLSSGKREVIDTLCRIAFWEVRPQFEVLNNK